MELGYDTAESEAKTAEQGLIEEHSQQPSTDGQAEADKLHGELMFVKII